MDTVTESGEHRYWEREWLLYTLGKGETEMDTRKEREINEDREILLYSG